MTLRALDLNLVAILNALFEEASVTAAARRLKVSQPTVSFALAKLRHFFGDELFVRHGGAMNPTRFAETLRTPVREVLAILDRDIVPKAPFSPAHTAREFTVCTSDIGELCFLPLLMEAFRNRAANASIKCVSLPAEDIHGALVRGNIDLVLGYFPDLVSDDVVHQHLFDHPFVCVARQGHPHFRDPLDLETFLACRHAVVRHEGRSQEIAERAIADAGLDRKVALLTPHHASLPFHIANSDLISIVPRNLATSFEKALDLQITRPPIDIPEIPLMQHWAKRPSIDPAVAWLIALVEELFLGRDPT